MQLHHDEQSNFFCMKADAVASLKTQGKTYDKERHLITVINRDDLVPLLNFMCLPITDNFNDSGERTKPVTLLGVESSGASLTIKDQPTENTPIPNCVPKFLRKDWE